MALQDLEKLHTSIVFLPSTNFELKLGIGSLRKIVNEPEIATLPPPVSLARITSLRDQVEITISQGRIEIRDHSEDKPGTDKFTRIVADFTRLLADSSGITYRALGWNYDVAFSISLDGLPAEAIARRFINKEAIRRAADLEVVGGAIRFFYDKEGARCCLYLEPRDNKLDASKFYAHINVHTDLAGSLPSWDELEKSFKREYEAFIQSVEAMLSG